MKVTYLIFINLFFVILINAQMSVTPYGGIIHGWSNDKNFTPKEMGHSGFVAGANLRLFDDGLCFLFSGEYGRFNLLANGNYQFFKGHGLSFSRGKAGIGFNLIKLGKGSFIRSKLQANALYINKAMTSQVMGTETLRENGYKELNEAIGGLSTGIGVTYKRLELDIEFERGFFNIYNKIKSTNMHFITLTFGIRLGPASDTYPWAPPKAAPRA